MASKDIKDVMSSLKKVYTASTKEQAELELDELEKVWKTKYPTMVKSWFNNWERLSNYFKYPKEIRKLIYTTNIIESFNSQLRKVTKSKRVFSSDMALLKLLYLVHNNVKGAWKTQILGWRQIFAQMQILFDDRINEH